MQEIFVQPDFALSHGCIDSDFEWPMNMPRELETGRGKGEHLSSCTKAAESTPLSMQGTKETQLTNVPQTPFKSVRFPAFPLPAPVVSGWNLKVLTKFDKVSCKAAEMQRNLSVVFTLEIITAAPCGILQLCWYLVAQNISLVKETFASLNCKIQIIKISVEVFVYEDWKAFMDMVCPTFPVRRGIDSVPVCFWKALKCVRLV